MLLQVHAYVSFLQYLQTASARKSQEHRIFLILITNVHSYYRCRVLGIFIINFKCSILEITRAFYKALLTMQELFIHYTHSIYTKYTLDLFNLEFRNCWLKVSFYLATFQEENK